MTYKKDNEQEHNLFVSLGSSNHAKFERQENDFYATEPKAIHCLMQIEVFQHKIIEPCCGKGHMSETIKEYGHEVDSFDIINRGYGRVQDCMTYQTNKTDFDIITNPPFTNVEQFIEKFVSLLQGKGQKLALFMRLLTLESKKRKELFEKYPPVRVWVSSSRINCVRNGEFDKFKSSAAAYAWFIWEAGYYGDTTLKWF